jgi:hypothetical protein
VVAEMATETKPGREGERWFLLWRDGRHAEVVATSSDEAVRRLHEHEKEGDEVILLGASGVEFENGKPRFLPVGGFMTPLWGTEENMVWFDEGWRFG